MKTGLAVVCIVSVGTCCFLAGRLCAPRAASVDTGLKLMAAPAVIDAPVIRQEVEFHPAVTTNANVATAKGSGWDEEKWNQLSSQPGTVARNAALAAMLEDLAAADPKRAMALALAERNLKLSETLEQAALRGWGKLSATDAADWALALPDPSARETALGSVFAGAASGNPEAGVAVCNLARRQNPGEATGYGSKLIDGLCEAGNYALAAHFSQSGEDAAQKSMWMAEAYSKWAELQPEQAGTAATAIADPAARTEALHGVVGGWAAANPAGLAQFLAQLPAGSDRGLMLGQALQSWVGQDPVVAANWINDNQTAFGQDLDQGMKAVAMLNSIPPSQAASWAEGIGNNELRSAALADILRNWLQTDFSAARNYFQNTADLMPAERQQLSEIIESFNTRTASQ